METTTIKKATGVIFLSLLTISCAGWRKNTGRSLDHVHEAGVVAREVALPHLAEKCREKALECRANGDKVCQPLIECHAKIVKLVSVLKSIQFLFIDGKLALSLSDQSEATEKLMKALELVRLLREQLAELGVEL